MVKNLVFFSSLVLVFLGISVFPGVSQGDESLSLQQGVEMIVRSDIKKRALMSGTLDLYDGKIDKVRNLSLLEMLKDEKSKADQTDSLTFRDMNSGAIVTVKAQLAKKNGTLIVENYQILKVEELVKKNVEAMEYVDAEVQKFMMEYLKNQAKFSGYFNIYDEKNSKLRKLTPIQFQKKVRKFGILLISRVECTDTESKEKLEIDVTVENKEGSLKIKSMRIFAIHPAE